MSAEGREELQLQRLLSTEGREGPRRTTTAKLQHLLSTEGHGELQLQNCIISCPRRAAKNCNCNIFRPRRATEERGELKLQRLLSTKGREELQLQYLLSTEGHGELQHLMSKESAPVAGSVGEQEIDAQSGP